MDERTRPVGEQPLVVRVPKDASVSVALDEVRRSLPEEHAAKKLRLMEVYRSRVYKVGGARGQHGRGAAPHDGVRPIARPPARTASKRCDPR